MNSYLFSIAGIDLTSGSVIVVILVFGLSLLQLMDAKAEYYSPFNSQDWGDDWTWHIHHDEKILIPDARYYFLRNRMATNIMNYKPYPVSAAFGLAGPLLVKTGFNIFGMNNLGLRFFYILIGGFANLCCVLCILHLAPGFIGVGISILYLFNYSSFILNRHSILENILTSFICGILLVYISQGEFFVQNIHIIGFFVAFSLWFKISFATYIYPLLILILLFANPGISQILRFSAWSLAGVLTFEGLHLLVLSKLGIAQWRYINFIAALKAHSGTDTGILQKFQPDGINVLRNFLRMFCRWYGIPVNVWKRFPGWITGLTLSIVPFYVFFVGIDKLMWVLSLYILLYLGVCAPFFFYLKRAVSCFPVVVMLLALLVHRAASGFSSYLPNVEVVIGLSAILFALFSLICQVRGFGCFHMLRSQDLKKHKDHSRMFAGSGDEIYAHCYAYRFFWQLEKGNMMSSDDQIMNNQMIVEWALKDQGKYIVLSGRGGEVDLFNDNIEGRLQYVSIFETMAVESDEQDMYAVFEINNSCCKKPEKNENMNNDEIGGMINRVSLVCDAWPFFKKIGVNFENLKLNRKSLCLLYEHLPMLCPVGANQISEIYKFLYSDFSYTPVLNMFGEELLIELLLQDGNLEIGIDSLQKNGYALQSVDCFCAIGDFYLDQDCNEAIKWYFKFVEPEVGDGCKGPLNSVSVSIIQRIYVLASKLKSDGKYDLAKEIFNRIGRYRFQLWGVYFHLGEIAFKENEIVEAKRYFQKCINENPRHKKARQYLKEIRFATTNI